MSVLVIVYELTSFPGPVVDSALVSISNTEFRGVCVAHPFFLSDAQCQWRVVCDQRKNKDERGSTASQGSVRKWSGNGPTPQCAPFHFGTWVCKKQGHLLQKVPAPLPEEKDTPWSEHTFYGKQESDREFNPGIRGNASLSALEEVRTSGWRSRSWSPTCLPRQHHRLGRECV